MSKTSLPGAENSQVVHLGQCKLAGGRQIQEHVTLRLTELFEQQAWDFCSEGILRTLQDTNPHYANPKPGEQLQQA